MRESQREAQLIGSEQGNIFVRPNVGRMPAVTSPRLDHSYLDRPPESSIAVGALVATRIIRIQPAKPYVPSPTTRATDIHSMPTHHPYTCTPQRRR